ALSPPGGGSRRSSRHHWWITHDESGFVKPVIIRRRLENRDDATLGSLERSVPPAGHSTCTHCRSRSASRRVGFARTNSPWRSEAPRQLRQRTRSVSLYFSIMVRFSTEY